MSPLPTPARGGRRGAIALAASGSGRTRGLATDLARDGARRLGYASLAFALAFATQLGLALLFARLDWLAEARHPTRIASGVAGLLMSLLVFAITRRVRLTSRQFLALGAAYEILGGLNIATPDVRIALLQAGHGVVGATWLAAWIAAFASLVPSRPRLTLATGLATAAMAPLVIVTTSLAGAPWPGPAAFAGATLPAFVVATFMVIPAIGIHRMTVAVAEARDLGSYRLIERLGAGGMGEVWRATHRMLSRPAAIKLIGADVLAGADGAAGEFVRRFELEAQATASLRSPHTVALYDFGVAEDGRLYYVMELLEGLDLDRMVSRHGPLPAERVVHLLRQVCDSLDEAHAAGLVHRDIKPSNVHVGRLGRRPDCAKVLDFGLVKRSFGADPEGTALTVATEIRGTPAFLAPEMAAGEPVDGRTDLYAVGCLAYWMLTGRLVFEGRNAIEMITRHVTAKPVPPSQRIGRSVPAELERIVLDCLAKDPAARPADARELDRRLAAVPLAEAWTEERAEDWWRGIGVPGAGPDAVASGNPQVLEERATLSLAEPVSEAFGL